MLQLSSKERRSRSFPAKAGDNVPLPREPHSLKRSASVLLLEFFLEAATVWTKGAWTLLIRILGRKK